MLSTSFMLFVFNLPCSVCCGYTFSVTCWLCFQAVFTWFLFMLIAFSLLLKRTIPWKLWILITNIDTIYFLIAAIYIATNRTLTWKDPRTTMAACALLLFSVYYIIFRNVAKLTIAKYFHFNFILLGWTFFK